MNTVLKGFKDKAREAAREGIVLLKNDNNVLPIQKTDNLSVFGRAQINYYRSGTGSGGAVHIEYSVNALDGFKNNETINLNTKLVSLYESFVEENQFDNGGGGWAAEPWFQKEMPLTDDIVKTARLDSNKALIIIGRTAGEDKDNSPVAGSYYLTDTEKLMISQVTKYFDDVVLVLNVCNIIDMSDTLNNPNLKSILYSWAGGQEGGNALADVISGDVTPSGKLANTIAKTLDDYPTTKNFGNKKLNYYEEDIYVGYRYFETFNKAAVLYPFGYGLSYTTFDINIESSVNNDNVITTVVRVINTGNYTGKEVLQGYYAAPQGALGKPALTLGAFVKTKLLQPGESQLLELLQPVNEMASYDDAGVTGNKSAFVLEKGEYVLYVGTSVRHLQKVFKYNNNVCIVTEQLEEALAPIKEFKRIKPGLLKDNGDYEVIYENVPTRSINLEARIQNRLPEEYINSFKTKMLFSSVRENKITLEDFVAQLSIEDLACMVRGEGMSNPNVTPGTAGAFCGLNETLKSYEIPVSCCADGPSGIRMDAGLKATQLPIGTLLACTWDTVLMEELYIMEGQELVLNEIDSLLGPGINIHRHPLNGRNFEYYSEDPYVTGRFATAATLGMHKGGSSGTLKHFAANDQETNRNWVDSIMSERALREIHLKGFEMSVKDGEAMSIMTAYNPINGHWAASNYDLNTTILRKEWGYKGIVMTDWWAMVNHPSKAGKPDKKHLSYMVRSQNDLYMVIENGGAATNAINDDLVTAVENNELTKAELQRCVLNLLRFTMQAPVINRKIKSQEIKHIKSLSNDPSNLTNSITFNSKINMDGQFYINNNGMYKVEVTMKHENNELAQSACNLNINNELLQTINLNGTGGTLKTEVIALVQLDKGLYNVNLDFKKPGLEIIHIRFIK